MRQTLSLDTCFTFGKYKGYPIPEVLREDPGYFLYLIECGYEGKIDAAIVSAVDAWASANKKEAGKARSSARSTVMKRALEGKIAAAGGPVKYDGDLVGLTNAHSDIPDAMQYAASAPVAPVKKEDPALWGTW